MRNYSYKARDQNGKLITGQVEAVDEHAAAKLLRNRGFIVVSLKATGGSLHAIIKKLTTRITTSDVVAFTRQLSTMINAGLPITEALVILKAQSKPSFAPIVSQVLADVEGGASLSGAMSRYSNVFSETYIALIKAGETAGVLDKVLTKLADNMEKSQEFKAKVKGAMIYPVIIVIGMIVVSAIMMIFVMPKLLELFTQFNAKLPFTTQILITMSNVTQKIWPAMIAAVGVAIYAFKAYKKTSSGSKRIDTIMLNMPLIGPLQRKVILAEMTRTLSLMASSGVEIIESLRITQKVVGNRVISDAIEDIGKSVEKGFPIAYSFAKHSEAFPFILPQMVSVGEETGKMDEVLAKISHVFETESDEQLKALTSAIEPLIMIVLGIGVAFLVVSIIMPIYTLTTSL